jgi:hypothetical protein
MFHKNEQTLFIILFNVNIKLFYIIKLFFKKNGENFYAYKCRTRFDGLVSCSLPIVIPVKASAKYTLKLPKSIA